MDKGLQDLGKELQDLGKVLEVPSKCEARSLSDG